MDYSQEFLNEMASKIDLQEYASRTVDFVKRSGNTQYAVCCFHQEKTASLAITPEIYHCFGCGKFGNIYTWIQETEHISFDEAVRKVASLTGSEVGNYIESETVRFLKLLDRLNNPRKRQVVNRPIFDIDRDYKQKFKDEVPQEWIDEGISPDVMRKYEIRIDQLSNRIVYPVRDSEFRMIGVKGRTRFYNYKELGIIKYSNYNKIGILDYFQGMMQAADYINESHEIIITEGLKSVMKLDGWGYHNAVSAETSTLNEYQIELLIRMQVKNVVIAFDKDVGMKKIRECTKLLKRFTNVYVVYDRWKLLGEKDSPPDRGLEVWKRLYEGRVRI